MVCRSDFCSDISAHRRKQIAAKAAPTNNLNNLCVLCASAVN